jgi:solute carrier family 25 (mitochondrial carnitine/acylcarnitine transporter), member 20/29
MQVVGVITAESAFNGCLVSNRSHSTLGILRRIFVKEGVPGLYRGVQAPLLAVTPAFAVSLWSYDIASRAILEYSHFQHVDNQKQPITTAAMAGALSSIPQAGILGPTDRIKCMMQVDKSKHTGFVDCFRTVYKEGGLRSLFRGTGMTAVRDCPGRAAYFGTYEALKGYICLLEGRETSSTFGTLLAGGGAGVAFWTVAMPFDTVKSRWQTAPVGKYTCPFDVLQTLLRNEGPQALFKGMSPALLRAFPANAACFCGVEIVKSMIDGSKWQN